MAHIEKATRLQVQGLLRHDTRTNENYSNECIDLERIKDNYNLVGDPFENYEKRMNEVYCLNRKDVNTLVEIVITKPTDVSDQEQRAFFEECLENTKRYFGEKNVISAAVHLDETTPHIHLKAIPVYYNEKKQREQVSFDKVCPRSFYINYHKQLSKDIETCLGHKTSILNDATVQNKTVKKLKQENLDYYDKRIKEHKDKYNNLIEQEKELIQKHKKKLESVEEPDKKTLKGDKYIDYDKYLESKAIIKTLTQENEALKNKLNKFELKISDMEQVSFQEQEKNINLESDRAYLLKENKKLKNKNSLASERENLIKEKFELKQQQQRITKENNLLKSNYSDLENKNKKISDELVDATDRLEWYRRSYGKFRDGMARYKKEFGNDEFENLFNYFGFGKERELIHTHITNAFNSLFNVVKKVIGRER